MKNPTKCIHALALLISLSFTSIGFCSENYKVDATGLVVMNDIVAAIRNTKEAGVFSKNVRFDEITAAFSNDGDDSIIQAKGEFIVGGDQPCGDLKIKIERTSEFAGWGIIKNYKATLDKSDISDHSFCVLKK
mgnify:CR=1 FL=1